MPAPLFLCLLTPPCGGQQTTIPKWGRSFNLILAISMYSLEVGSAALDLMRVVKPLGIRPLKQIKLLPRGSGPSALVGASLVLVWCKVEAHFAGRVPSIWPQDPGR